MLRHGTSGDDVELLLARQLDEVHRVAGDADGQLRVELGVVHGVQQRLAIEDVDVDVVAALQEVAARAGRSRLFTRSSSVEPSAEGTMVKV